MELTYRQFEYKNDIDWLYNVYSNPQETMMFLHDFRFSTREEFEKVFLQRVLNDYYSFLVICDNDGTPLGIVYGHDYSANDLHIKFSLYVLPKYRSLGVGAIAAIYFVDSVFKTLPVRKVYETVFEDNKVSLKNNLQAGFVREATLKEYLFVNGKFCDLIYLSVTRKRFYDLYGNSPLLQCKE